MNEEFKPKSNSKIKITENVINFLLIFILGFLIGVAVKMEARKRVTIGYNDYLIAGIKQDFDLIGADSRNNGDEEEAVQPGRQQVDQKESQPAEDSNDENSG